MGKNLFPKFALPLKPYLLIKKNMLLPFLGYFIYKTTSYLCSTHSNNQYLKCNTIHVFKRIHSANFKLFQAISSYFKLFQAISSYFKLFQAISSLKMTAQFTAFLLKNILYPLESDAKTAMPLVIVVPTLCPKTTHFNQNLKTLFKDNVQTISLF
jgi:hypothetical protein